MATLTNESGQPIHKNRSIFSRIMRYVKTHPISTALAVVGALVAVVVTVATSGLGAGILAGGIGIAAGVGVALKGAASGAKLLGGVVREAESAKKRAHQLSTGNPNGKHVQDYLIINEKRFGESKSVARTQRRFEYVKAKEMLQNKLMTTDDPYIKVMLTATMQKLDSIMVQYENHPKGKTKADVLQRLDGVIKEISQPNSTLQIARKMGSTNDLFMPRKDLSHMDAPIANLVDKKTEKNAEEKVELVAEKIADSTPKPTSFRR